MSSIAEEGAPNNRRVRVGAEGMRTRSSAKHNRIRMDEFEAVIEGPILTQQEAGITK